MTKTQTTDLTIPAVFQIGDVEVNKETLIAQRDKDVLHVINGVADTAGLKKAIELRAIYRTTRTTLDKIYKELSAPHTAYNKGLKKITDNLGAEAFKGEQFFNSQIVAIDNEKIRIANEKLLEQQRRVSARVSELTAMGSKFDGTTYYFDYSEDIATALTDLQSWSDDTYNAHLEDVKTAWANEQTRLHEETLKAQQAEEERAAAAEQVRIRAEANEIQEQQLLAKRTALRERELKMLGFVLDAGDNLYHHADKPFVIDPKQMIGLEDDVWDNDIKNIEHYLVPVIEVDAPSTPKTYYTENVDYDEYLVKPDTNLEEAYQQDHHVEPLGMTTDDNPEYGFMEATLPFSKVYPFIDTLIAPKLTLRIFPSEYETNALNGVKTANSGTITGSLNWVTIKE